MKPCSFVPSSILVVACMVGCSDPTPAPHDAARDTSQDAPHDAFDATPDTVTDRPTQDVPGDATADDRPTHFDVAPVDVPSGTAWCDMPMTPGTEVRGVTLPPGFCIRRYAAFPYPMFGHPRVMAFAPGGDLFVTSPSMTGPGGTGPGINAIVVLPDDNHDGVADGVVRYAEGATLDARANMFAQPGTVHGILFHGGYLYFTNHNGVYRVPFRPGDRRLAAGVTPELVADLANSERWTHTLTVDREGTIYVSMGIYGSSTCPYPSPERGAILAIGPGRSIRATDGGTRITHGDLIARGFRNPMYIRCHPWACYAAELTDDGWTERGREKIVRFGPGQDYGYPCCYDRGSPSPANPDGGVYNCNQVTPSPLGFPVGHTPFGHDFAPASWPAPYANGLFVGLHGVVGSWAHTGINWAPTRGDAHEFQSEQAMVFLSGWGRGTPNEGRVADLTFAPDGRLFFTDDQLGHVYWIAPTTLRRP